MAKVITDESLLSDILSGAGQLADTVTPNFGPNGKNTVIDMKYDIPRVVNEGKDILPEFGLEDSVENVGAVLLRDAALQTGHLNGDGTIATTIITKAILEEGQRLITSGANPIRMRAAMKNYIPQIEEAIRKAAVPADTREMLMKIALGSADDEEMAAMVLDAMDVVGVNGAINVVDSQEPKNRLEAIDGIKYDYGLENMVFVNRPVKKDAYLEKPYVLLANMKINALKDIEKILRSIMEEKRPLLIIAQDVNEDVQKILAINTMR